MAKEKREKEVEFEKPAAAAKNETVTLTSDQLMQMFESEKARLQAFEQNIAQIRGYLTENESAREAVNALLRGGEESTIMAALGGDLYVETHVQKKNKLKKIVAGKAIVEISLEDAKALLDRRADELSKAHNQAMQEQQQLVAKLNQLAGIMDQGQRMARRKYMEQQAQAQK